jgi:hypothetical protein
MASEFVTPFVVKTAGNYYAIIFSVDRSSTDEYFEGYIILPEKPPTNATWTIDGLCRGKEKSGNIEIKSYSEFTPLV